MLVCKFSKTSSFVSVSVSISVRMSGSMIISMSVSVNVGVGVCVMHQHTQHYYKPSWVSKTQMCGGRWCKRFAAKSKDSDVLGPPHLKHVISRMICVAVCCSGLQCAAVYCSALQCVAVRHNVLQCVAMCCSVLQCVAVRCSFCCKIEGLGCLLFCVSIYLSTHGSHIYLSTHGSHIYLSTHGSHIKRGCVLPVCTKFNYCVYDSFVYWQFCPACL